MVNLVKVKWCWLFGDTFTKSVSDAVVRYKLYIVWIVWDGNEVIKEH